MVQYGTSLDMETIKDAPFDGSGQENGPYYFVKKPNLPLNADFTNPQHPHFQEDAPQNKHDTNDLSLGDITEGIGSAVSGVGDAAKSLYEGAKGLLGITPKAQPPSTPQKQPSQPKIRQRQITVPQQQGIDPNKKHIENIQTYLQKTTPALKTFLGSSRYTGNIDGNAGTLTNAVINKLESALSQLLKTNDIYGMVLRSTPGDIEQGVRLAAAYKAQLKSKGSCRRSSRDERILRMAKILNNVD